MVALQPIQNNRLVVMQEVVKMKKKLKSQQGFSLSEMMLAVLIIALTMGFIGGGITVVKDAYLRITLRAEAQTLMSTAVSAISVELRNADEIQEQISESGKSTWTFYNIKRGYRIYFENIGENIFIKTVEDSPTLIPLLTNQTKTNGLVPKIIELKYENQVFTYVIGIYYKDEIYAEQTINVRPMNAI